MVRAVVPDLRAGVARPLPPPVAPRCPIPVRRSVEICHMAEDSNAQDRQVKDFSVSSEIPTGRAAKKDPRHPFPAPGWGGICGSKPRWPTAASSESHDRIAATRHRSIRSTEVYTGSGWVAWWGWPVVSAVTDTSVYSADWRVGEGKQRSAPTEAGALWVPRQACDADRLPAVPHPAGSGYSGLGPRLIGSEMVVTAWGVVRRIAPLGRRKYRDLLLTYVTVCG